MLWSPGIVVPMGKKPAVAVGGGVTFDTGHAQSITFSNGNLTIKNTSASPAFGNARSTTSHSSGKFYIEITVDADDQASGVGVGVGNSSSVPNASGGPGIDANLSIAEYDNVAGNYANQGYFINSSQSSNNIGTFTAGAVICMAVDLDNNRIWWRKNGGNWNANGANDPATNTGGINISAITGPFYVVAEVETTGEQLTANFGATAFSFTAPSGFGNW